MSQIKDAICYYISTQSLFEKLLIFLSSSDVHGEGEIKILNQIFLNSGKGDSHLVISDDSDMLILGLMAPTEEIYCLQKETVVSIQDLKESLFFNSSLEGSLKTRLTLPYIYDFTFFATISQGNDYLPPIEGFKLSRLWKSYLSHIPNHNDIGSAREHSVRPLITEEMGHMSLNLKRLTSFLNQYQEGMTKETKQRFMVLSHPNPKPIQPSPKDYNMVSEYLRGCIWLLELYSKANTNDYSYYYGYSLAPDYDIFLHCSAQPVIDPKEELSQGSSSAHQRSKVSTGSLTNKAIQSFDLSRFIKPLKPIEVLMATLPPHGAAFLPEHLVPSFESIFSTDHYEQSKAGRTFSQNPQKQVEHIALAIDLLDNLPDQVLEEASTNLLFCDPILHQIDRSIYEAIQITINAPCMECQVDTDQKQITAFRPIDKILRKGPLDQQSPALKRKKPPASTQSNTERPKKRSKSSEVDFLNTNAGPNAY